MSAPTVTLHMLYIQIYPNQTHASLPPDMTGPRNFAAAGMLCVSMVVVTNNTKLEAQQTHTAVINSRY